MTTGYVNSGIPVYAPGAMQMPQNGQFLPMPMPTMPQPPQSYYGMPYYPVYSPQRPPVQNGSPSVSAVKIDINGASVDTGSGQSASVGPRPVYPGMAQLMPPACQRMPQYPPVGMPQCPVPGMQAPMAYPIGAQPVPAYIPPQQMTGSMPPPQMAPAPLPPPPQVVSQVVPPQVMPQPPQPVQNTQVNQVQPQATEQVNEAIKPLVQSISVITPQPGQQSTLDDQSTAIQTISQYAKAYQAANDMIKADPTNPQALEAKTKADKLLNPVLINENTFKGLANIAVSDTSSLSGPEKQKADENRIISMWTLAMLQKLFRQEMNSVTEKDSIPPMSMNEVPGIVQIVENIKSDPNPDIRVAGIIALTEVADPADPKDAETMKVILQTAAEKDGSEEVKQTAQNVLKDFVK